jgi:hypothetical protein
MSEGLSLEGRRSRHGRDRHVWGQTPRPVPRSQVCVSGAYGFFGFSGRMSPLKRTLPPVNVSVNVPLPFSVAWYVNL